MSKSYNLFRLNDDGTLECQPTIIGASIEINGKVVINPTEAQLRSVGFKNMISAEPPSFNLDAQFLVEHYHDNGEVIIQSFEIVDKPAETGEM